MWHAATTRACAVVRRSASMRACFASSTRRSTKSQQRAPTARTKKQRAAAARGAALEARVARLLESEGHSRVRTNVRIRDTAGRYSEVDVIAGPRGAVRRALAALGMWRKDALWVECKAYASSVPLEDVAKFREVLRQHGRSPTEGLFVTTATFTPRASATGVPLLDGSALRAREKRARSAARRRVGRRVTAALLLGGAAYVALADVDVLDDAAAAVERTLPAGAAEPVAGALRGAGDAGAELARAAQREWEKLTQR